MDTVLTDRTLRLKRPTKLGRQVKMVSFDVFGTAISRQLLERDDIHSLTASSIGLVDPADTTKYVEGRLEAERFVRARAERNGRNEIRIAEIRTELRNFLPDDWANKDPIKAEIQLEQQLVRPNRDVLEFYRTIRNRPITVAFAADTCLPHGVVASLLRSCGYNWDHLFVSSQSGKVKRDGSMFRAMVERTPFTPHQIMHIGKDPERDVEAARSAGLQASLMPSPPPPAKTPAKLISSQRTGTDSIALSLAADHRSKTTESLTMADVGYYALGPMLAGFGAWVNDYVERVGPDHVVPGNRLPGGEKLLGLIAPATTDLIRQIDNLRTQPGERVLVVDLGWDDAVTVTVQSQVDSRVSVAGMCVGLINPTYSDTTPWAFSPNDNQELAARIKESDLLQALANNTSGLDNLVNHMNVGILAFAQDFEPWTSTGPTSGHLCWPALRAFETPTLTEARRFADIWADDSKAESSVQRPSRSLLPARSNHPALMTGMGAIWRRGSETLEAADTPDANRKRALRSLRFRQRRNSST